MTVSKAPSASGPLERLDGRHLLASAAPGAVTIELRFPAGPAFVLDVEADGRRFVLPGQPPQAAEKDSSSSSSQRALEGKERCWVLPARPSPQAEEEESCDPAWMVQTESSDAVVSVRYESCDPLINRGRGGGEDGGPEGSSATIVTLHALRATLTSHRSRPHADVDGAEYALHFPAAAELADALAGFYWDTMLPSVVERTRARRYPDRDGFVVSTLAAAAQYQGTYPDVDHEFHIKGRLASGGALDLDVVRRMIELQLRLMREDPQLLWRDPCSVQPDGRREYHVRRGSLDGRSNAVMFLVTGNVEVVESVWLVVARTRDLDWLKSIVSDLEGALSCVEACVDGLGRLWSDVYYEDQVIKDGRETLAAALASSSFGLMAELENELGRVAVADRYVAVARRLADALGRPLPQGHWDPTNNRFVDWVDRSGVVHDHIHLLANELPVLLGAATPAQTTHVLALLEEHRAEFQRFPSFLAARIQDYTDGEIGDGGPYDLCAAGRYWCWDAAFWARRRRGDVVLAQLLAVARMGARDGYLMAERYDMNHVYYRDGPPWHGAAHYYEYPCVFARVLLVEFLGLRPTLAPGVDLLVAPRLVAGGSVTLGQEAYMLRYEYRPEDGRFSLRNLGPSTRAFGLDLSALFGEDRKLLVRHCGGGLEEVAYDAKPVKLAPGAEVTIRAV